MMAAEFGIIITWFFLILTSDAEFSCPTSCNCALFEDELEIQCSPQESVNDTGTIIFYKEYESLEIDCGNMYKDTRSFQIFLKTFNFVNVSKIAMEKCPFLENLEEVLKEMSSKNPITTLKYINSVGEVRVTKEYFAGMNSLQDLQIMSCVNFEEDVFARLPDLINIDLESSCISKFPLLESTNELQYINMADNLLEIIPDGIFKNLSKLETLNLSHNRLTFISRNMLSGINLYSLHLGGNKIDKMQDNLFDDMSNVVLISLSNNRLQSIPVGLFEKNLNLKVLDMSYNMLHDLSSLSLSIQELKINNNLLQHIPSVIRKLSRLEVLYLGNNFLKEITINDFSHLEELKELYLDENLIRSIHPDSFIKNINLLKINLAKNSYEPAIDMDLFGNNRNLEEVNLSHNLIADIQQIFRDITFLPNLNSMDLSFNNITRVDLMDLRAIDDDSNIMLVINLDQNPLKCDCHNYELMLHIQGGSRGGYEITTGNTSCLVGEQEVLISSFPLSRAVCALEEVVEDYDDCPNLCGCFWRPSDSSIVVDCSGVGLTVIPNLTLPSSIPFTQTEVRLDRNKFSQGPTALMGFENVTTLLLSHNLIQNLSWTPPNVKFLTLDNNHFEVLTYNIVSLLNKSVTLSLYNNSWTCDCSTLNFTDFLKFNSKQIIRLMDTYCRGSSQLLVDFSQVITCESFPYLISTAVCVLFVLLSIALSLGYYFEEHIKIWLYTHNLWCLNENEMDKDKKYDIFFVYSHKDEDFVLENLVGVLESGPNPYVTCIHFRDWLPGGLIASHIHETVNNARRTLVVLSKNFLSSEWGKAEFRLAYSKAMKDGRARVIPVLLTDLDINDLDEDLRDYVRCTTYLKWGETYFWKKLEKTLPSPRHHQISA